MKIRNVLDRAITFQRVFVEVTGSIQGALLLSQAMFWQNRCADADGWWFKTIADWTDETGMTRREIDTAREHCKNFLVTERKGVPAKLYYRIDDTNLEAAVSLALSANQEGLNSPIRLGGKRQTTNNEIDMSSDIINLSKNSMRVFTDGWIARFEKSFGIKYLFQKAQDGSAAARLIKLSSPEELLALAEKAWSCSGPRFWNCENRSKTIAGFASAFNQIRTELAGIVVKERAEGDDRW